MGVVLKEGDVIRINISNTVITEVTIKKINYKRQRLQPVKTIEISAASLNEGTSEAEVTFYI